MKKVLALLLAAMLLASMVPAVLAEQAAPTTGGHLNVLGFSFATFFLNP